MKEVRDQFLQGIVLIVGMLISVKLTGPFVEILPEQLRTEIVKTSSTVLIYAGLLLLFLMARSIGPLRKLFVANESYIGQYISAHTNNEIPIVAFFELKFNFVRRKYEIFGTAVNILDEKSPSGYWSSLTVHIDHRHRSITYPYFGGGKDVRPDGNETRSLGLASVEFLDDELEYGRGHFLDDWEGAKKITTEVIRLTPDKLKQFTGRKIKKVKGFSEMLEVAKSYKST